MARKNMRYKTSYKDLLNMRSMDVFSLNKRELSKVVTQLAGVVNKRVARLEKKDNVLSPALESFKKYGSDRIHTKGLSLNALRSEFTRAKYFLEAKTATITGAKKYTETLKRNIQEVFGTDFTDRQISDTYMILHRMQESNPVQASAYGSERLLRQIRDEMVQRDFNSDDVERSIQEMIKQFNEDKFADQEDNSNVSPLFNKV